MIILVNICRRVMIYKPLYTLRSACAHMPPHKSRRSVLLLTRSEASRGWNFSIDHKCQFFKNRMLPWKKKNILKLCSKWYTIIHTCKRANATIGCINGSRDSRARMVMALPNSWDLSIHLGVCIQYNKWDMDKSVARWLRGTWVMTPEEWLKELASIGSLETEEYQALRGMANSAIINRSTDLISSLNFFSYLQQYVE